MLNLNKARRGDTIIEVLVAITIFSMIAISAILLMNSGLATSQRSLEITAARQQIDGQAEALRFIHGSYVENYAPGATYAPGTPAAQYVAVLGRTVAQASSFTEITACPAANTLTSNKFVMNPYTGRIETAADIPRVAQTSPMIVYTGNASTPTFSHSEGLWVEAVASTASSSGGVGFVDFHIRACWDSPGQSTPMTIGTIVRLYDPR